MKKRLFFSIILTALVLNIATLNVSYSAAHGRWPDIRPFNSILQGLRLEPGGIVRHDFETHGFLSRLNYEAIEQIDAAHYYISQWVCRDNPEAFPEAARALGGCLRSQGGYSDRHINGVVNLMLRHPN